VIDAKDSIANVTLSAEIRWSKFNMTGPAFVVTATFDAWCRSLEVAFRNDLEWQAVSAERREGLCPSEAPPQEPTNLRSPQSSGG